MNRKLLLSLALWVLGAAASAFAANTLTVYDGENINEYVPVYGYYVDDFLKCEYVIPATDLTAMTDRQITGIKWYLSTKASSAWGGTFTVFVKEVAEPTLSAFSGVEGATIVYEGVLDGTGDEMEVNFTNSYEYKGGNLLIGVYTIVEGGYSSSSFIGTTVEGASVQGWNGASLSSVSANQRNFIPKTTFTYLDAGAIVYNPPKDLTVSEIGTNTATVSWTPGGAETAWNLQYKKANATEWTPVPVTGPSCKLDELENATLYDVQVQSNYGDGNLSIWIGTQFFTTVCEEADMGEITYELGDAYGDGWTNNAIKIVHHNTGDVVGTYTIITGKEASGTVKLCYGEQYDFVWVPGSWGTECSYTFYDPEGNVIITHASGSSPASGVIGSCTLIKVTCPRPSRLAASEVTYNSAKLTWTPGDAEQDAWELVYGPEGFNPDDVEPIAVSGNPELELSGLAEDTQYAAYVRGNCGPNDKSDWSTGIVFKTVEQFPKPAYVYVDDITYKSANVVWESIENADSYNLRYRIPAHQEEYFFESFERKPLPEGWSIVDSDGDGNNWNIVDPSNYSLGGVPLASYDGNYVMMSQSWSANGILTPDNWLITKKVPLKGTLKFYVSDDSNFPETYRIYVSTTDTELTSFSPVTEDLTTPGSLAYVEVSVDLSSFNGAEGYIAFRHYNCTNQDFMFIDAVGIYGDDIEASEWVTVNGLTENQYTITGLTAETPYEVEVQTVYGENLSSWTAPTEFTTTAADLVPTNLNVYFPTCDSGTAYWNGVQDKYNLRYRKSLQHIGLYEDFEGGKIPDNWGNVDADGDGYKWGTFTSDNTDENGNPWTLGNTCATSASYITSGLRPDNWLISPEVELKGTFSVWLRSQDADYPENFSIYAIVGNDTTEIVSKTSSEILYTEYTVDLTPFDGALGKIAIRHHDTYNQFRLNVDNFFVKHGEDVPAGEWVTIENVSAPFTITDLARATKYDVQVQGIYEDGVTEWSDMATFTTRDIETISLEDLILNGDEGMTYLIEDDLIMVAQTPDGQFTYVTDGEDNWVRLSGVSADLFSNAGALSGVQGKYTGSNFNPTVTIDKEITTIIPVDPIVPDGLDLTEGNEEPINIQPCKVMTFSGYVEDGRLVAEPGNDFGMTAGTNYVDELEANKKYDMTVALELIQPWVEIDVPIGAPRRISAEEAEYIDFFQAVVLEAKTEATGVKTVTAAGEAEVRYYDAQGRYVGKTLDSAPAGFYIGSDGSKVIK